MLNINKWKIIDEDRAFYKLPIFKFAIGFPFVVGIILIVGLFFGPDSPWDRGFLMTAKGYENALHLYKVPLYVMSFMVVFGVMVARFHRSKQATFDISAKKLQQRNDHESEFIAHFDVEHKDSVAGFDAYISVDHKLYTTLFPENIYSIEKSYLGQEFFDYASKESCMSLKRALDAIHNENYPLSSQLIILGSALYSLESSIGIVFTVDGGERLNLYENYSLQYGTGSLSILLIQARSKLKEMAQYRCPDQIDSELTPFLEMYKEHIENHPFFTERNADDFFANAETYIEEKKKNSAKKRDFEVFK